MERISHFYFNRDKLREDNAAKSETFLTASPFPHVVFDNFLPHEVIQQLIHEFPGPNDIEWTTWGSGRTRQDNSDAIKLGQSREEFFGPYTRHFFSQLNSQTFISFLEELTGVSDIIVDPSYNGCGLHSTGPGGRLMIHTDANRHPHSGKYLHQILNLIIYLNDDWEESYGGNLELWTQDRKPALKILPIANRAVLFSTGTRSFHGHPVPLTCPPDRRRNSIAVYYYSHNRVAGEDYDGMQRAVRWVTTTADDKGIAKNWAEGIPKFLEAFHGKSFPLSWTVFPIAVPGINDDAMVVMEWISLKMVDQADSRIEIESWLKRLADTSGMGEEEFSTRYTPCAEVSTEGRKGHDNRRVLLVLFDHEGAVHLAVQNEAKLIFFGYIEEIIQLDPRISAK